jgi:multicomponent Na+:H+ antiporter subunit E
MEKVLLSILWLFVWLLLSWPPDSKDLFIGVFVSVFVTFMTVDTFRFSGNKTKRADNLPQLFVLAKKIFWFTCYSAVFLWECLKANIDVAWRVLCPDLPIRPGTIKVRTELKSDIGLTFLANSITLTPGKTTVDIDKRKGLIYIHVLFLKDADITEDMRLAVVTKYERILKRIFE